MRLRLAAFAASVVVCVVTFPTHAGDPLTLDDAFQRVANTPPNLRLFGNRRAALAAELDRPSLRPALVAGASVETAFGPGQAKIGRTPRRESACQTGQLPVVGGPSTKK